MAAFARNRRPRHRDGAGALAWPKYRAAMDENLVLKPMPTTQSRLKSDLCDFWDSVSITTP